MRAATRMAIASKVADSEVVVLDKLEMEAPKTAELAATLKALGLEGSKSATIALGDYSKQVYLSSRNLQGVSVLPALADLNALNILRPKRLLLTKDAVEWIQSQGKESQGKQSEEATA